jgi:hypothetical protein
MPRGSANVKRKSGADEKEVGKDVWWAFMYVCCVNGVERVRPPLLSPHLIFFSPISDEAQLVLACFFGGLVTLYTARLL